MGCGVQISGYCWLSAKRRKHRDAGSSLGLDPNHPLPHACLYGPQAARRKREYDEGGGAAAAAAAAAARKAKKGPIALAQLGITPEQAAAIAGLPMPFGGFGAGGGGGSFGAGRSGGGGDDEEDDEETATDTDPFVSAPHLAQRGTAAAAVAAAEWTGLCMVCGTEGELLCCDGRNCNNAMHLECAGLDEVPEGDWLCPPCTAAGRRPGAAGQVAESAPPVARQWMPPMSRSGSLGSGPTRGSGQLGASGSGRMTRHQSGLLSQQAAAGLGRRGSREASLDGWGPGAGGVAGPGGVTTTRSGRKVKQKDREDL